MFLEDLMEVVTVHFGELSLNRVARTVKLEDGGNYEQFL